MSDAETADATAKAAAEAKQNVAKCEQEIATIKASLRNLGQPSDSDELNTLTVTWVKVEGLPDSAKPKLSLQLSSPVETAELTKIYADDAVSAEIKVESETEKTDEEEKEKSAEEDKDGEKTEAKKVEEAEVIAEAVAAPIDSDGAVATFRGVETGQATLAVEAMDADIPLGSSTAYDLAPYTSQLLDAMNPKTEYVQELAVAILPPGEGTQDNNALVTEAVCTVTLKITYQPSAKDKREELYELLNKASEKKAAAVEKLRHSALAASRAKLSGENSSKSGTVAKPAVKPGFLNKKTDKAKDTSRLQAWYEKTVGPNSILRLYFPVAKNYLFFFGFLTFSHFKGQILALPQPV